MAIEIKSPNQLLGDMVRKIIAETPLNDIYTGSVLLTLLEAAASNDYENNAAILNVLELLNIDAIKNNDLDARAADYGLTRRPAIKASGLVNISNTNITKRSTGLYVIKPAPISGQSKIYVNNTTGWSSSGSLYIGRGTDNFEGPIPYTSINVYPTYSEIVLGSSLQKDHLISDVVIDSQGEPDRLINAGTIVKIPANNQNPEVQYVTLRSAVIPAGEDMVSGIEVVALVPGSQGNAGINSITQFDVAPFSGAAVTNTTAFSNGQDIETDVQLRNRIKSYSITLARGTAPSILASVIGVSDPDDSKQVASAIMTEPVKVGDPSILYIDDGSGFQPSFAGQSVDKLLTNATGQEEFLQLSNYPVPRPQVINTAEGPFNLPSGSFLRVIVDGQEETIYFGPSQFLNISAATVSEVIVAINDQSTLFKARFVNSSNNILIYPVASDAELIQVAQLRDSDDSSLYANSIIKFPTDEFSYISLYQNSTRLREKSRAAELTTAPYAQWNTIEVIPADDIVIEVDGTPAQARSFPLSDFTGVSSFASLSLQDWVSAFNRKFAGLTAEATPSETMIIRSNRIGAESSIVISGGSLVAKWFPNLPKASYGQSAQFELNRQTGNLRILTDILPGDSITAGVEDAKGFQISSVTTSGTYNVSTDASGRPAEMIIVADSSFCNKKSLSLAVGSSLTISTPSASTMRILGASLNAFSSVLPGDFVYIAYRSSWLSSNNTGLFKVKAKGAHTVAGADTFIEVDNIGGTAESVIMIDSLDIKAFETDGLPQIWRGTYVSNPPAETISNVVDSLNSRLINVKASIYKSNSIKLTSSTETDGSIAIPVCIGNAAVLFTETSSAQYGNPPHIASRTSDRNLISMFKRTSPVGVNVFLGRHTYTDVKGSLTSDSVPNISPYSELVESTGILTSSNVSYDDYISFTRGNNSGQIRTVKAKIPTDQVGTQEGSARTEIDHVIGDELELQRPMSISSEDSIVVVMDSDASTKTIDIAMSRNARVNSGSGIGSFIPTTTEFSAFDDDNEPGIDFSNTNVWGTTINKTDFSDYAVWMRARNWYSTGGVSGVDGKMLVRSAQFGPNGEKLRFSLEYPNSPDQDPNTTLTNTPSFNLYSYFFGSGAARALSLSPLVPGPGTTISVQGPYPDDTTNFPNGSVSSGDYYDYTFSSGSLATVQIGDVLSILSTSGVSNSNSGQFRIWNKDTLVVRILNPNASVTTPGTPETALVTTIADVVGTPTIYTVDTVADVGGSLHQTYFIVHDTQGSVAVWYDVDNVGASAPPHGANRAIKVATVATGDTADDVANKTAQAISLDSAFSVAAILNQITITNLINGPLSSASAGTSGFSASTSIGTANVSVDGKYFLLNDQDGSVAVWYDVDDNGTAEPFHGADRSIKVSGVTSGMSAVDVASATVQAINFDASFSASNVSGTSSIVTIVAANNGNLVDAAAGTSGFSVTIADGTLGTAEAITDINGVQVYPLTGTDVATIASTVNAESIVEITPIGNDALTISRSTREDVYAYSGDSSALAFGHNPSSTSLNSYISLHDGINWIKSFQNSNPNFTLKTNLILNNVAPSVYQMDCAPNYNSADLGERIKLIPVTVKNIYHQLTQKALSQLPIVANINISDDRKNIQITSKNLGSSGAIEVIGGNANKAQAYVFGESEVSSDINGSTLLTKVPAYPDTFNVGDIIKLQNDKGVRRISRLNINDSLDVQALTGVAKYLFNDKLTNISSITSFTITDVSASYGRPSGFIWRWTHDGSATLADVVAGDQLLVAGTDSAWAQGNKLSATGDDIISGFPIVYVNDTADYIDVLNPRGKSMTSQAVGLNMTINICPAPSIKWNLAHAARVEIDSIILSSGTITVNTVKPHLMNTNDMVDIIDSDNVADATYGPITSTSSTQFTFSYVGTNFNEVNVGASMIKSGLTPTQYRVEKLGLNGLTRIRRESGESPRFADSGVAVDDYVVISGSTFAANNSGLYRVLAVDNESIIVDNDTATREINTLKKFNNKDLQATWSANTSVVTGIAGTFKYVSVGTWVKKPEDPDSAYRQVIAMTPATPALATTITLGANYSGSSAIAPGISYDMYNDYDSGVILQSVDDIAVYEGDSVLAGDSLSVQNIVDTSWFSTSNIGTFEVLGVGTDASTLKPYIKVSNSSALSQSNRLMSVSLDGLYVTESLANRFYSMRQITNVCLDDLNPERRAIYMTPDNRSYKFSESNTTSMLHMGKLGYSTDVTSGVDGYLYYTGLLRRVQRIVDGFEPDSDTYPGRRAIGGAIEILPPLNKRISISVDITTDDGVNLGDISNNIKSVVINYIDTLGVGEDVILSEIIASIMQIKGVGAVTFTYPTPNTERITIADNEKATITPNDIGIA